MYMYQLKKNKNKMKLFTNGQATECFVLQFTSDGDGKKKNSKYTVDFLKFLIFMFLSTSALKSLYIANNLAQT